VGRLDWLTKTSGSRFLVSLLYIGCNGKPEREGEDFAKEKKTATKGEVKPSCKVCFISYIIRVL
jgi:hypothetical protein